MNIKEINYKYIHDKGGKPTIIRRIRKIVNYGFFSNIPPFFYYCGSFLTQKMTDGTKKENLSEIQEYTRKIIKRMEKLYENMDKITVIEKDELEYLKEKLFRTMIVIREQATKYLWMEFSFEPEFEVLE